MLRLAPEWEETYREVLIEDGGVCEAFNIVGQIVYILHDRAININSHF